eukprot:GHVP01015477.1.p1 GENE.GHVP01015477.1~~GHVP01015477.1.p1  ORF type:complete len:621 (-),score=75.58 GHVP01015477.1:2911-4623(-)
MNVVLAFVQSALKIEVEKAVGTEHQSQSRWIYKCFRSKVNTFLASEALGPEVRQTLTFLSVPDYIAQELLKTADKSGDSEDNLDRSCDLHSPFNNSLSSGNHVAFLHSPHLLEQRVAMMTHTLYTDPRRSSKAITSFSHWYFKTQPLPSEEVVIFLFLGEANDGLLFEMSKDENVFAALSALRLTVKLLSPQHCKHSIAFQRVFKLLDPTLYLRPTRLHRFLSITYGTARKDAAEVLLILSEILGQETLEIIVSEDTSALNTLSNLKEKRKNFLSARSLISGEEKPLLKPKFFSEHRFSDHLFQVKHSIGHYLLIEKPLILINNMKAILGPPDDCDTWRKVRPASKFRILEPRMRHTRKVLDSGVFFWHELTLSLHTSAHAAALLFAHPSKCISVATKNVPEPYIPDLEMKPTSWNSLIKFAKRQHINEDHSIRVLDIEFCKPLTHETQWFSFIQMAHYNPDTGVFKVSWIPPIKPEDNRKCTGFFSWDCFPVSETRCTAVLTSVIPVQTVGILAPEYLGETNVFLTSIVNATENILKHMEKFAPSIADNFQTTTEADSIVFQTPKFYEL